MLKRNRRGTFWLLLALFALLLVACSPAEGDDPAEEVTNGETTADEDGAKHETDEGADDDSAAEEAVATGAKEAVDPADNSIGDEETNPW